MMKHEPEVRRANARLFVDACNRQAHDAPWTTGRTATANGGGSYEALDLAQKAYRAHGLPYEGGLSNMERYDPRRFTWVCENGGEIEHSVKVRDDWTGRVAVWPHWFG